MAGVELLGPCGGSHAARGVLNPIPNSLGLSVLGSGATLLRGIAPVPLDRPVRYGLTAPREVCFVSESRCYIDLAAVDRLPPPPFPLAAIEKKPAALLLQRIAQTPTNAVDERGQQNYIHNDA